MKKQIIFIALILAFAPLVATYADDQGDTCKVGDKDLKGNLIFHCFHKYAPVALKSSYGFLLFRNEFGEPRYILARRESQSYDIFGVWEDLLLALKELPKGSQVTIYDRCTVPPFYSYAPLEKEMLEKVRKDFSASGVSVPKDHIEVCTCDVSGREWKARHRKSSKPKNSEHGNQ